MALSIFNELCLVLGAGWFHKLQSSVRGTHSAQMACASGLLSGVGTASREGVRRSGWTRNENTQTQLSRETQLWDKVPISRSSPSLAGIWGLPKNAKSRPWRLNPAALTLGTMLSCVFNF